MPRASAAYSCVSIFPFQCELVLDAGDADAEVVAAAHGAGVHGQVGAVEAGQLFGHLGHVGAVGIAPLHHQRQQRVGRGRLAAGREREVDADAAAVEVSVRRHTRGGRRARFGIVSMFYRPFCIISFVPVPDTLPARGRRRGWRGRCPCPHTASATAQTPCRWRPDAPAANAG